MGSLVKKSCALLETPPHNWFSLATGRTKVNSQSRERNKTAALQIKILSSRFPSFPPLLGEMMPGGGSGYSNGYARYEPQKEGRIRRGRGGGGHRGGGGRGGAFRVSPAASSSSTPQVDRVSSTPQWAAFDAAYFQSYSHVGIHEEMIKVLGFFCTSCWNFKVGKLGFKVLCAKFGKNGKCMAC